MDAGVFFGLFISHAFAVVVGYMYAKRKFEVVKPRQPKPRPPGGGGSGVEQQ